MSMVIILGLITVERKSDMKQLKEFRDQIFYGIVELFCGFLHIMCCIHVEASWWGYLLGLIFIVLGVCALAKGLTDLDTNVKEIYNKIDTKEENRKVK